MFLLYMEKEKEKEGCKKIYMNKILLTKITFTTDNT